MPLNSPVFMDLDAGSCHSLGIGTDGSAWAWGNNADGKLGDGTTRNSFAPVRVLLGTGVTVAAVSAGGFHSLALGIDGALWAWGNNADGQLGNGSTSTVNSSIPVRVSFPAGVTVTAVSAGAFHSLALDTDGSLWAWGSDEDGQLGKPSTGFGSSVPVQLALPAGITFTDVSAGSYHSLAVDSLGFLYAWGKNDDGQLGDGTDTSHPVPVKVAPKWAAGTTIDSVSAGAFHSVAVDSEGTAWAWGLNQSGQLGDGTTTRRSEPVRVVRTWGPRATIASINAGRVHTVAVDSDGTAWSWGGNEDGQLGDATRNPRSEAARVARTWPEHTTITSLSAGGHHGVAVDSSGAGWAWGNAAFGQLGDGYTTTQTIATAIRTGLSATASPL
ncbi:RCC1 domain-containing protein [Arthrobacter sp. GMC3]|uniref:RCC1 domain-containing protein n=1 Tax=Arthrobacter sp. GMC3 TaxID=2058894 RepID=UPI000CE3D25A|nr:RCC1 domain-containing protein [Arthrobacter sp. GMC3]